MIHQNRTSGEQPSRTTRPHDNILHPLKSSFLVVSLARNVSGFCFSHSFLVFFFVSHGNTLLVSNMVGG
jgi:hypothetical protein